MPTEAVRWTDDTGDTHVFSIYQYNAAAEPNARLLGFPQAGLLSTITRAIYIFTRYVAFPEQWVPLYVGESCDMPDRLQEHDEIENLRREGVTHVHVHLTHLDKSGRVNLEHSLRRAINPVLNPLPPRP